MLRFLADENVSKAIVRALRRAAPPCDIVRSQDIGLSSQSDPEVLAWAAAQQRIVLTHDVTTMTKYAFERVERAESMPGVIQIPGSITIRQIVEGISLIAHCSHDDEWEGQVLYLPFP